MKKLLIISLLLLSSLKVAANCGLKPMGAKSSNAGNINLEHEDYLGHPIAPTETADEAANLPHEDYLGRPMMK